MRRRRSSNDSSGTSMWNGRISVAVWTVVLMDNLPCGWAGSAQRTEGGAHLGGEDFGLLPCREVAALLGLVEVADVGVGLLHPRAGSAEDLARERGEGGGDRHVRRRLTGGERLRSARLPVRP